MAKTHVIRDLKSTANHKLAKEAARIIKRGRKPLTEEEKQPDVRFIRVAGMRLAKILKLSKGLRACANTSVYEYTDEQVDKIFSLIEKSIARTKEAFLAPKTNGKVYKVSKLENPLA
jgi:hypothetical protein